MILLFIVDCCFLYSDSFFKEILYMKRKIMVNINLRLLI